MNARPYLPLVLLLTACYQDSNSEASPGSGATGTTSGGATGQGTLSSGGPGGSGSTSSSGSTTTSPSATAGGSAGEGQGGMAGGGASGASGSGGEGGAVSECAPALHALVRAILGDFDCPELEACFVESCPDELAAAMGDGWVSGDHGGGICSGYADCVEGCGCESECSLECRDEHAGGGACLDAIIEVSLCRNDACPAAADSCVP